MLAVLFPLAATMMMAGPTGSAELPTYRDVGLQWARGPSIRDMARQHRVSTTGFPFRGEAEVSCTPDPRGRLACEVLNETPENRGYGRAALRVMRPARVTSSDGYSPEGRTFGFRLRFGNWPVSSLPDTYHPVDQNLRWTARPELLGWFPHGLTVGQEVRASVDCTAKADGALTCKAIDGSDPRLIEAALHSMESARVERTDGEPLEGSPLRWTFRIINQSHCGGGGLGYGVPDAAKGGMPPPSSDSGQNDPLGPLTSLGGSYNGGASGGSCLGSVVQMAGSTSEP